MKFQIKDKRSIRALILISSYIVAIILIFAGLYAIIQSAQRSEDESGGGALGVFSQFYTGNLLPKGKENIRAVWIATVSNINYPSGRELSEKELMSELDAIVQSCAKLGANAIFFQVRPCSDALYKSDIFPQSHYVSGKRGEEADGAFDSLGYLCKTAKAKGIAVHAWVNPVRVLSGTPSDPARYDELCSGEPADRHPEWTVVYADGKMYFDLGFPEVRSLIADGVREIVSKYDVAGVIFDDYFYPYPTYGADGSIADFDDSASYKKYGKLADKGDFRRECVRSLVRSCYAAVKKEDKSCLFGISPFGVWKNSEAAGGAGTLGLESYSAIYCDTVSFIREGTVDYIAPQLYWEIGNDGCDYIKLADWWSKVLEPYNIPLIPCLAPYRYSEGSYRDGEITAQLKHARTLSSYGGCAMYGYAALCERNLSVGRETAELWKSQ